jgi:hypothetical protein
MVAPLYYTADIVRALPEDGNRYEVVHGELLVTPSPGVAHQWVISLLLERLLPYLALIPEWRLLTSPAEISGAPDILVQPDIFVAAPKASIQASRPHEGSIGEGTARAFGLVAVLRYQTSVFFTPLRGGT